MEYTEYMNNHLRAEVIHGTQVRIYNELNNDVKEIKTFKEVSQAHKFAFEFNCGKNEALKPGAIVIVKEVF